MKYKSNLETLQCPKCGTPIELSEAMSKDIEDKLKAQFNEEKEALKIQMETRFKHKEELWEDKLSEERLKIKGKLEGKIRKEMGLELKDLESEIKRQEKEIEKSKREELVLRKQKRELEEKERNLELDVARRIAEESEKAFEKANLEFTQKHKLDIADKEKQLAAALSQTNDLRRKLEQKSQQAQGEVLELELEDFLKKEFPFDSIEPVAKGVKGGDIIQVVQTQSGAVCGKILWETKRTKSWSDLWVRKLKDDLREAKADLAVLVSQALPKGFHHFRQIDGVWVTDIPSSVSLALALRLILVRVAKTRQNESGKRNKAEMVYKYLTGTEFRNRVEAIVEAFRTMSDELNSERQAFQRIWAKREKQIESVISNTIGLYGDLEGIAGPSMPIIPTLELHDNELEKPQ